MLRTTWSSLLIAGIMGTFLGCEGGGGGPATAKVSGTVTSQGKPVAEAIVTFVPKSPGARAAVGTTDASGRFTLTTLKLGDGAMVGSYGVTVTKVSRPTGLPAEGGEIPPEAQAAAKKAQEDAKKSGGTDEGGKDLLPTKFRSPDTSGLTAEVKSGRNDFPFDLKE